MRSDWLLYLAIFLTCYSNTLRGQNPFFRHYDTDDGLPSNEIYLIERDDQGLIWMVTDRGVCVYDGYDFRVYTTEDGLSYNTNFRIFKDRHDRMWFTAWDGSISCYENGRFRAYHLPQDSLYASFPGYANQLWFGQDDMIYIAKSEESRSTNLFRFNPHTNQTQLVSLSELGEYLQEDKANGIVLTEIGGRPCIQGRMNLYATSIVFDGLHHRWYATFERNYSLYIDSRSSTSVRITEEKIHNIYLDSNHDLWFCTAQGLLRYENADINEPETLFFEGVDVTSILMDREGSYWVATRGKGLFWVPSFALRSLLQPEERMEERRVLSAAPLSEHLILGTISDGLFVLDRQFEVLPTGKEWRAINEVKRMYPTEGHDIHLSLVRVDERAGGLNLITEKTIVPHTSSSLVLQLRNGLFISSRRFGYSVSKAWGEEAIFSVAQEFKDHGSTFNGRIKCMGENRDHLWLGTLNGLYHLPTADLLFRPPDKDSSQLLSVRIEDLSFVDQQGMWVATIGNGLVYKKGPHLQAFSTEVGMSSNLIHRIYPENDSVLWVGTNQGLDKVTYRTTESGVTLRSIANFSTADGLASNFINDLNIWQDQLVLATDHGINFFPPSALQESTTPPLIHWEDVRAGPHSVLDSQNLQLAHDENDLEFKYLGVCFKKPQNQRFYRYRLRRDGQEPEWYYTDNRSVRFQDLAAGQYRFEVAAQNKTGYWSKQTLGFDFYIQPHYTEQLWFRLLAGLFLVALLALGFYLRTRRIQQVEAQKRKLQGAELNLLRNQMNPHFIFNALNSIQNFVFHQDVKNANYYLSKFSRLVRNSLEYSRTEYISIAQEIKFIRSYLELEKLRFDDRFSVEITVDPEIPPHHYLIPPLLLQPVLENSVKHAFKNISHPGKISIQFLALPEEERIKIIIQDNGQGLRIPRRRRSRSAHQSMGLSIIENRIKLLNSNKRRPRAHFEIFNRYDARGTLIGTQAQFFIPIQLN